MGCHRDSLPRHCAAAILVCWLRANSPVRVCGSGGYSRVQSYLEWLKLIRCIHSDARHSLHGLQEYPMRQCADCSKNHTFLAKQRGLDLLTARSIRGFRLSLPQSESTVDSVVHRPNSRPVILPPPNSYSLPRRSNPLSLQCQRCEFDSRYDFLQVS